MIHFSFFGCEFRLTFGFSSYFDIEIGHFLRDLLQPGKDKASLPEDFSERFFSRFGAGWLNMGLAARVLENAGQRQEEEDFA